MTSKNLLAAAGLSALLALVAEGAVRADTPLEPVGDTTFCSNDAHYCVHSTVRPAHLEVFDKQNPARHLWSKEEYVAKGFVSDDGKTVVSCYGGLNLIPMDASLDFAVVRILDASGGVREVRLRSLYTDMSQLPHTDSHLEWGRCVGIDGGRFVLERADGTQWRSGKL
ncbi:hypothetical protein [Luteibacter sp. CQ10]|uniref:hypothetical protein n=1 Tax=Luteibacter sp. CQ10 TaxID=2805821 RepID=UPI0034A30858